MIITTLAREKVLEGITREKSLAHAEACARCAGRLAEERALLAGVQAVVEDIAGESAPMRVEAALLLAFQERAGSSSHVLRMPQSRDLTRWMWAAAAAAILALVSTVVVSRLHGRSFNENNAARELSSGSPAPTTPPERIVTGADDNRRATPGPRRREAGRHAILHHEQGGREIATDFLPLLDGDDLSSLDSSQLVRVELPGSALIAVGLPVDAEMANTPVKADVLLGHDGLARAIRFVR
ncbi:MAG TPA: hypothetical protein VGV87_12110 [Blastocatellia bacterium]|nr:hypothetical protein [Blastocatellia bacterium]